ncbi:MAG: hypothetical protein QG656_1927, partial [Candidatus Hydrogenedentes bacterium]|nr:hypothetical protein [Candidatus Hydrogenedentota bacterium]
MMFLEYCVPGAFVPILSLYLASNLGFAPKDAGLIMAMPALAAIVAPFMASHIADRFIGAERMLALCHVLCGTVMLILSVQTRFWLFL